MRTGSHGASVKLEAVLHPEEAELVWTMLDHAAKHVTHAPHPRPTSDDSAELCGTPASILHQRVDATKRAFNRADALVSITQAYLRGDQPNRAPVEIAAVPGRHTRSPLRSIYAERREL